MNWAKIRLRLSACKHKNNRAYSLRGYSPYTRIFQNGTKFTWSLDLEQPSCTLSNCTVLHEYIAMDSLVFLCFYFVHAMLAAHHVCGCLALTGAFQGTGFWRSGVSWIESELRNQGWGFCREAGYFFFSLGEGLRIFKCWRNAVHKKKTFGYA